MYTSKYISGPKPSLPLLRLGVGSSDPLQIVSVCEPTIIEGKMNDGKPRRIRRVLLRVINLKDEKAYNVSCTQRLMMAFTDCIFEAETSVIRIVKETSRYKGIDIPRYEVVPDPHPELSDENVAMILFGAER